MNKEVLWKAVLAELELDMSQSNFNMWLRPTSVSGAKLVDSDRQIVTIACRTPYQQNMVESRYYGQIKQALDRVTEKNNELVFTIEPERLKDVASLGPLFSPLTQVGGGRSAYDEAVERVGLRPDYTFNTFAVSSTNEMAHAAASAVARSPGKAYHLLFLYGGVGVGKTHLMTAVGHEILKADSGVEMIFCTGEQFMNELVEAIQTKNTTAFKTKYRRIKLFLVDDIQFIAGKDAVQEEFFHTFNAIVQNQGQIVLTSDRPPEEIILLEDRLRSRFEGGLTIDIQAPNLELRTAILNIKARARGVVLPMDVAQMIAGNIESTRRLEGFLVRLITETNARNQPITFEMVEMLLKKEKGEIKEKPKKYIPPHEVIEVVGDFFSLKAAVIKGKRRVKNVVDARHLAMYVLRQDLEISLKEVGRVLGGKDHTTVMHAVEKVGVLLGSSEKWRRDLAAIQKRLFGNPQ